MLSECLLLEKVVFVVGEDAEDDGLVSKGEQALYIFDLDCKDGFHFISTAPKWSFSSMSCD